MVKRSIEIKNPKTPVARRIRDTKNSLRRNSTSQEAKIPANTTREVSVIIATDIPSAPTV